MKKYCIGQDEKFELFRKATFEAAVHFLRTGSFSSSHDLLYRMVSS